MSTNFQSIKRLLGVELVSRTEKLLLVSGMSKVGQTNKQTTGG